MKARVDVTRLVRWRLVVFAIALMALYGLVLAPAESRAYIYWSDGSSSISRADLNGSNVSPGFITDSADSPAGVAVTGDYVYWSNPALNSIGRAALDGSGATNNFAYAANPFDVAASRSHLYWVVNYGRQIGRSNLDGSEASQSFISFPGLSAPYGLAVSKEYLYWSNPNAGTIGRANRDGTGVNHSFITGLNDPRGVAVDTGHLYWASFGSNSVGRAKPDGTGVNKTFISGSSPVNSVAVDKSHVYWGVLAGTIGRAGLDGTGIDAAFITTAPSVAVALAVTPDTTPPTLTLDSGPEGPTTDSSPTFGFTAESGSTVTCSIDSGTPDFRACSSATAHSPSAPLADGAYTFRVRAADELDNEITLTRSFEIDTTAPETVIDAGPSGIIKTDDVTFAFSSPDAGAEFECLLDEGAWSSCTSPKSHAGLRDGSHSFQVRAVDAAGNTDPTPANRAFTIDTSLPSGEDPPGDGSGSDDGSGSGDGRGPDGGPRPAGDTSPPVVKITKRPKAKLKTKAGSARVQVKFRSEAGATFQCRLNKAKFKPCSSPFAVKAKASRGKGRKHTLWIKARDMAGNESRATKVSFRVALKR